MNFWIWTAPFESWDCNFSTHVSANVADPAGVDILRHVVAIVGRVPLEPLGIDLALVEEGVTAQTTDSTKSTAEIPGRLAILGIVHLMKILELTRSLIPFDVQ